MSLLEYLGSHPPRCLENFVASPIELSGVSFYGHASPPDDEIELPSPTIIEGVAHVNVIFALSCQCGSKTHYVHGYRWTGPHKDVVLVSPLFLRCAKCAELRQLIDTDLHGFDAEMGGIVATVRAQGDRAMVACPTCRRQPFEVFVRFEYPEDLLDDDNLKFAGREQDLFTWFSLLGKCTECAQLLHLTDFECA